jgi:uncharacterized membrane protein YdjX (TVP38/TMEM64 family)
MRDDSHNADRSRRKALVKISVLLLFVISALYAARFTPLVHLLSVENVGRILDRAGFWAPLLFMMIYAAGVCLFVPGTLLTGIGAAVFGPYRGFLYVWIGAMIGASAAFFIGRNLGRDFAASMIGNRLKRYDEAISRNGFATVLYLRLIYFPFTPMNFGMGLTGVRFRDYFTGTALGILVGTFILTFFIGTLKEIWVSGDWSRLLSIRVGLSVGLFVFSLFIPRIIKGIRGEGP